ncbi:M14 family metallopeptidase [Gemmatimonadota bacterium]
MALVVLALFPGRGFAQRTALPLTRAERTDFRETTRYDEVVAFMSQVVEGRADMHLTTMGYTFEGRPIPMVVVGDVADGSPEAVRASGKTRVYVQGGIHAGEICGKEALLILLRELANGDHSGWSGSLVLLIAPLYNADGNERVNLTNRRGQHGPIGGMGQRANAMGLDLNRDQMKLDAPESRSLVQLYTRYDPHLSVDLHVTNGTRHGYHLTYAPPLSPNTPREIDELLRGRWLPEVTSGVKEETGWDMYYYGGARQARGDTPAGWVTFSHMPRYVSNYIGLRNRFGILGEAYSYATFQERIQVSYWFTREILDFAGRNATEIQERTAQADARSLVGDSLGVRAEVQRSAEPVTILMGEVVQELNPFTGQTISRRTDTQVPTEMYDMGTFRSTEWARVPAAYFIPPGSREIQQAVERLGAHGIRTSRLDGETVVEVEVFTVDSVSTSTREYEGHQAQEVLGSYGVASQALPAGTVVVSMDQPLARVAFSLLEPRSDDGFVAWGFFTNSLQVGEGYPVLRSSPGSDPGLSSNSSREFH